MYKYIDTALTCLAESVDTDEKLYFGPGWYNGAYYNGAYHYNENSTLLR